MKYGNDANYANDTNDTNDEKRNKYGNDNNDGKRRYGEKGDDDNYLKPPAVTPAGPAGR